MLASTESDNPSTSNSSLGLLLRNCPFPNQSIRHHAYWKLFLWPYQRRVYTGEPAMKALCHCSDCRKISGGLYSHNIAVPAAQFKVTSGSPKEISKTADSGKSITSCFCADCGTTLYRFGDTFGGKDGMAIIKAGILDDVDVLNDNKPTTELYAPERITWVSEISGANQVNAMPEQ